VTENTYDLIRTRRNAVLRLRKTALWRGERGNSFIGGFYLSGSGLSYRHVSPGPCWVQRDRNLRSAASEGHRKASVEPSIALFDGY
jgi:hypothetical protein